MEGYAIAHRRRRYALGASGGALALALAFGGYLWWKRRAESELGWTAPSWLVGGRQQDSSWDMARAAKAQVERAEARTPLDDARNAEDRSIFTTGARASAAPAYYHTAYWLGVGSRLLGYDADLVALAKRHLAYGAQWSLVPGASLRTGNVPDIYRAAHALLAARGARNRGVAGAAAQVAFTARDVEAAVERDADTNPLKMAPALYRKNASDTLDAGVKAAEVGAGLLTGRKPTGMSDGTWFFLKWGLRIGIGVTVGTALLIGARIYFAPEYEVAKRALAPVGRAAAGATRRGLEFAGEAYDDYAERRARRRAIEREESRERPPERRRLAYHDDEPAEARERAELRSSLRELS